uniref:MATH domain-containing protein n=1 Tax=Peronospora matthiolae TaxID=2874970 RepID=A0AAV1U1T1_9STRA
MAKKSSEKAHAMKLFVKDSETEKYVITIKNVIRYELALESVGSDMFHSGKRSW